MANEEILDEERMESGSNAIMFEIRPLGSSTPEPPPPPVENGQTNDADDASNEILKDVTAAVDICRCNPCRCDPLLNDCSVSCNPVVDIVTEDPQHLSPASQATAAGQEKPACSCSCASKAASQMLASITSCQARQSDQQGSDPCCIVVCLKHLKQQYLTDRPSCCT